MFGKSNKEALSPILIHTTHNNVIFLNQINVKFP